MCFVHSWSVGNFSSPPSTLLDLGATRPTLAVGSAVGLGLGDSMLAMLVGALLLLPRLKSLPPRRHLEVPPPLAAIRRISAPRARAGGGRGGKTSEAHQTLRELSQAQQDGGLIPLSAIESIKRLSSDRTFVLAAVQMNDNALAYVSEEMQADREVVLAAVRQNPRALAYVSADLFADRTIVLAAVEKNPFVLQYASRELRADREVMLAAVQQAGVALQHASAELQADPEIVLVAMKQDQGAIRYASAELHASGHPFGHLDTLADCGQLKVLRSLRSVLDCGVQMQNCFRDFDLTTCGCQVLVMLEDESGTPLAVGAFKNGGWDLIQHNQVLRGGNRACGRGDASALQSTYEATCQQFEPFVPALQEFEASYYATLRNEWHQTGGGDISREGACPTRSAGLFPSECQAAMSAGPFPLQASRTRIGERARSPPKEYVFSMPRCATPVVRSRHPVCLIMTGTPTHLHHRALRESSTTPRERCRLYVSISFL